MTHTKVGVVSAAIFTMSLWGGTALAQDSTPASRLPLTPQQRSTADQVAQAGFQQRAGSQGGRCQAEPDLRTI